MAPATKISAMELRRNLSEILRRAEMGESFSVVYGWHKKPVAKIEPVERRGKNGKNRNA